MKSCTIICNERSFSLFMTVDRILDEFINPDNKKGEDRTKELTSDLIEFISDFLKAKFSESDRPYNANLSLKEIIDCLMSYEVDEIKSYVNKKWKSNTSREWNDDVDLQIILLRIICIKERELSEVEPLTLNFRLSKKASSKLKFIESNPVDNPIKINNKELIISQLLGSTNKSLFPKTIIEDAIDNIYNYSRNEKDIKLLESIIYWREFSFTNQMSDESIQYRFHDDTEGMAEYEDRCRSHWKKILLKIACARLDTTESFLIKSGMFEKCLETCERWWKSKKNQPYDFDDLDPDERNRAVHFAENYLDNN